MIYNSILCIGDSLTLGSRDEYRRGYPAELSQLLNEKTKEQFWVVINEGITGERSNDILRRLVKILILYEDAYVVLLQVGTNDTIDLVPKEIYKDTMFQLIKTCQAFDKKVILGSLISLDGIGLMSYSADGALLLYEYNKILKELSKELKVSLVDLTLLSKYRIDKCHFNNQGYKEMAKLFLEEIIKL